MSDPDKVSARDRILGYFAGFNGTWVLVVGRRAGLLAAVEGAKPPVTDESLARAAAMHLRYVRVWTRAAYAFGFVDWDEAGGFRLAPHMKGLLLDPTDPYYLGGRGEFYAATTEDFAAFPARLRDGKPFPRDAHDPALLAALAEMTKPDFANLTGAVIPRVPGLAERLSSPGANLLDVGCGAGFGLVHFARAFPALSLVGIEPDGASRSLALERIRSESLGARVRVEPTPAQELADDAVYDAAVLNVSLHETGGPDAWPAVLARVFAAVRPGGAVLVSELPYPADVRDYRALPAQLLAGVQHHEALVGCSAITVPELASLLSRAGFASVERIEQPNPARVVYAGRRPG